MSAFIRRRSDNQLGGRSSLPVVSDQQVWRLDGLVNGHGGHDWFVGAVAEADVVLEDLITMIHPDHSDQHQRVWLRHLSSEACAVQRADICANPLAAVKPRSSPRTSKCFLAPPLLPPPPPPPLLPFSFLLPHPPFPLPEIHLQNKSPERGGGGGAP